MSAEYVRQIVAIVHVTLETKIIIITLGTLESHSTEISSVTAIAHYSRLVDSCKEHGIEITSKLKSFDTNYVEVKNRISPMGALSNIRIS